MHRDTATPGGNGYTRYCYECGAEMREVWRTRERNGLYIWYECRRPECAGLHLFHLHPKARPWRNTIEVRGRPTTPSKPIPAERLKARDVLGPPPGRTT